MPKYIIVLIRATNLASLNLCIITKMTPSFSNDIKIIAIQLKTRISRSRAFNLEIARSKKTRDISRMRDLEISRLNTSCHSILSYFFKGNFLLYVVTMSFQLFKQRVTLQFHSGIHNMCAKYTCYGFQSGPTHCGSLCSPEHILMVNRA